MVEGCGQLWRVVEGCGGCGEVWRVWKGCGGVGLSSAARCQGYAERWLQGLLLLQLRQSWIPQSRAMVPNPEGGANNFDDSTGDKTVIIQRGGQAPKKCDYSAT